MRYSLRFFAFAAVFCGISGAAPADRISRPVSSAETVVLKGQVHRAAAAGRDLGAADPEMAMNDIVLLLKPSAKQQADLEQLLADQQNPSSKSFHQWLTPEAFGDRFGLSAGDHDKVAAWLRSENFAVNDAARGRNWVAFSGTAGQVSRTFRMPVHMVEAKGARHYANMADPSVPAALADIAGGFLGLNDFLPVSGVKQATPDYTTSSGSHYLAPSDYATIYDLNPLYSSGYTGSGQSIAVVGQSDLPISDVRAFRTRYGLPANDPVYLLFGTDPGGSSAEAANWMWSGRARSPRRRPFITSIPAARLRLSWRRWISMWRR